jgi:hypothetical protein
MGHADIQTTMRYLHYRDRGRAAGGGVPGAGAEPALDRESLMARPQIGDRLPRIANGFAESDKWSGWILAPHGHGRDWARALAVGIDDVERLFGLLHGASRAAPVVNVYDHGRFGYSCAVDITITLNGRTARARTVWHYKSEAAPPRLVTAYPRT